MWFTWPEGDVSSAVFFFKSKISKTKSACAETYGQEKGRQAKLCVTTPPADSVTSVPSDSLKLVSRHLFALTIQASTDLQPHMYLLLHRVTLRPDGRCDTEVVTSVLRWVLLLSSRDSTTDRHFLKKKKKSVSKFKHLHLPFDKSQVYTRFVFWLVKREGCGGGGLGGRGIGYIPEQGGKVNSCPSCNLITSGLKPFTGNMIQATGRQIWRIEGLHNFGETKALPPQHKKHENLAFALLLSRVTPGNNERP